MTESPQLVITAGEPSGIGPDLVIQLAQRAQPDILVVIADAELLQQRANMLGLPLRLAEYSARQSKPASAGTLYVWHTPLSAPCQPGQPDPANANYVLESLRLASHACLNRQFDALVTGPVHKGIINQAGIPFSGHTEYLAELAGCKLPVMMLLTEGLRVALATTHLPLRQVCDAITPELIEEVLTVLHHDLQTKFAIPEPRISVCGLNPHAGEDGHLGREEIDIIQPVMQKLIQQGLDLTGPVPADTAFTPERMKHTDAYLAMYHDQGLPVLKHLGFGRAINITLGLPYIRTSVDHGTALELAGTGQARIDSLLAAIRLAGRLSKVSGC